VMDQNQTSEQSGPRGSSQGLAISPLMQGDLAPPGGLELGITFGLPTSWSAVQFERQTMRPATDTYSRPWGSNPTGMGVNVVPPETFQISSPESFTAAS
jgi:hypothetical protein